MEITISIVKSAKRVRSTTMRILNRGVIELRAPFHAHLQTLIDFVSKNGRFLAKSLTVPKQAILPGTLTTGDDLFIFGKHFIIELLPAKKSSIEINYEDKVVTIKKRGRTISRKQFYEKISPSLLEYVTQKSSEFEKVMSPTERYKNIRTALVRSMWGSCTRTGSLMFNRRLIHYPTDIIDYVVIHELAHLQEHNHKKAFWNIVEKHYPDIKQAREILKKRTYG